ncbi:hypothetical protein [Nocardioides sp. 616]|uniref:hypothetical protein n=1 Tax=Nocardioides sp. 616 TaxID=2268090 RepID=UPI0013B372CA|nr:hypothetical protein [Nocardioides sp. 616]
MTAALGVVPTWGRSPATTGSYDLAASTAGGGVIWTVSWDDRVHVSTDGARTFTQIPAR